MSAPILSIRSSEAIKLAVRYLQAGEVIIIPTDTIYGLAAYPTPSAIERLAGIRGRRVPEPALPLLLAVGLTVSVNRRVPRPQSRTMRVRGRERENLVLVAPGR